MGDKVSDKQKKILDFLDKEIQEKGYPPSVREICQAVGLKSTSTVHGYLQRLEKKGLIKKDATKTRALKVLNGGESAKNTHINPANIYKEYVDVPIIGKVTAGQPILAVENVEDTFPIPVQYTHNSDVFMLKVKGESMIEAGILDGDLVLVKKQSYAANRDIVVAMIENEATVKRFFKEKNAVRLQPENSSMEPIFVRDVSVLGKVVGLFRTI
ncbi:MAG: transcriptional repressor LexA [Deltaproteobacteria bacterium]